MSGKDSLWIGGCVKVSKVHQGGLGKRKMVGLVQGNRGKFMGKVQKIRADL